MSTARRARNLFRLGALNVLGDAPTRLLRLAVAPEDGEELALGRALLELGDSDAMPSHRGPPGRFLLQRRR